MIIHELGSPGLMEESELSTEEGVVQGHLGGVEVQEAVGGVVLGGS